MKYPGFFIAGIAIGTLFFATLAWQIRLLLEKGSRLFSLVIAFVRFGLLAGSFYLLLICGGWQGGCLALAGLIATRYGIIRKYDHQSSIVNHHSTGRL